MNRPHRFSLVTLTLVILWPSMVATALRPNVLIFLTDDQGWGDLSIHGNTKV
jgi:hypothetical protein